MAESLLLQTHQVSDLCIGKSALRWLPPSSTVADAVAELQGGSARGPDAALAVWDGSMDGAQVAGRVCMADVLLFLCADDGNLASPSAALQATLSDLLAAGAPPVRLIQPDASVLEAADAFLDGAHSLVVPIRERWRSPAAGELCWLTLEDLVRFFLSSIALFAPTASRSVSDLGVVRAATLAVAAGDTALSAVPLLRTALESHASVAVVSGESPRHLVGDISPSTALGSSNVSVAAAIAALSVGNLMAFLDWGGAPPDATLHSVCSRLRRRNLHGMLDLLLYGGEASCPSSSSSCSSSASSSASSSDEDEDYGNGKNSIASSPCARRGKQRLYSSSLTRGVGRRRADEALVCRRGSSLVAVMVQAMAHRATQVWVVDEERELVGVVGLLDVVRVLRHHLHYPPL